MDSERWQRISEIFYQALTRTAAERDSFLMHACHDDHDLLLEIQSLLASDDRAHPLLDHVTLPYLHQVFPALASADLADRRLGPWRLVHALATGGMGTVWLAERADGQYEQRVAIKLIRPELITPSTQQRFRAERQMLAQFEHPHIARLLDGGETDDGILYLVMEFIEGEPIDQYCHRHRLNVQARLSLFQIVCAAVSAAHRNLVVHGDLKPANILVTHTGEAKLLDFGVATVLQSSNLEAGTSMADEPRWITVDYASPEQINGQPLSTATDVYALGLILYGLLTGRLPFERNRLSWTELQRRAGEEPPLAPSAAVAQRDTVAAGQQTTDPARDTDSRSGKTSAHVLTRANWRVSRELDSIVLKAIANDYRDRYPSVDQLMADIAAFLSMQPVWAHRGGWLYRTGKFARRNRLPVLAGIILVCALAGWGVTSTWQAVRLMAERDQAQRARHEADEAAESARKSAAVSKGSLQFLQEILASGDPFHATERDLSVRQLVDRAADRMRTSPPAELEIEAAVEGVLGTTFHHLAEYDNSVDHLRRALELSIRLFGETHEETFRARLNLGDGLVDAGKFYDACIVLDVALADARRLFPHPSTDLERCLAVFGHAKANVGDFEAAEQLCREALYVCVALGKTLGADNQLREASANVALANVLMEQNKLSEAEPLLLQAIEIQQSHPDHPLQIATTTHRLAFLAWNQGEFDQAIQYLNEVLKLRRKFLDESHHHVLLARSDLAAIYSVIGDHENAEAEYRTLVPRYRQFVGEEHADTLVIEASFARVLRANHKPSEAEPLLRHVLEVQRRTLGDHHPDVMGTLDELGNLLTDDKRLSEAEPILREVLDNYRKLYGREHISTCLATWGLARLLKYQGQFDESRTWFEHALEMRQKLFTLEDPRVKGLDNDYLSLLVAMERYADAIAVAEKTLAVERTLEPRRRDKIEYSLQAMAQCFMVLDEPEKAIPIWRELFPEGLPTREGSDDWTSIALYGALGRCLALTGQFEEAEPVLRQVAAALQDIESARPQWIKVNEALAHVYERTNRPELAAQLRMAID